MNKMVLRKPSSLRVISAIARVTFLEVIRDKILYNILLCAVLLFAVGILASLLTFIQPERVILDFGVSAVSISCVMIAVFTGASLLGREFERRTIYVALARPITRAQFIVGKFMGLIAVITVNWVLISISFIGILIAVGDGFSVLSNPTMYIGLLLVLFQSFLVASIAILFSTVSTTSLSVIITIGFYLIGTNVSQIRLLATRVRTPLISAALNGLATLIPNLEHFGLGLRVTYGLPVTFELVVTSIAYGVCYTALLVTIAGVLARTKEV